MKKSRWILLVSSISLLILGTESCVHRKSEPHSVTLTWRVPPPKPGITVVGYNVYRRTGDGGPFVKIADQVPGAAYEDRIVSTGRTYFYVVTAVDQDGRESRFSAETKAEIP